MLGTTTTQAVVPLVGSGLSITAGAVSGSVATALGISTAVAVPVLGAAVAGIMFAVTQFTQGCQSCIVTSNQANKIEDLMKQNLAAWQGSNKTCDEQKVCLSNFDQLWNALVQFCQNPQFGGAGENCINDRKQGACHYGTYPNCWNWFVGYRDPIANDSCSNALVVNNLASDITTPAGADVVASVSSALQSTGISLPILAAIGLVAFGISQASN